MNFLETRLHWTKLRFLYQLFEVIELKIEVVMILLQQQQQQGLQQLLQQLHAQQLPHGAHGPVPHPGLPVGPGGLLFGGALGATPSGPLAIQPHALLKPNSELHSSRDSVDLKSAGSLPEDRLVRNE